MIARLFMQNCTYHMKMLNEILVSERASLNPYLLHVIDLIAFLNAKSRSKQISSYF